MKNKLFGTRDLWDQVNNETPVPSRIWHSMNLDARASIIDSCLRECFLDGILKFSACSDDGMVYFFQLSPLPVKTRTDLLLNFEEVLKEKVDVGITVWIEPQSDKNALRKFRGVKVSSL